MKSILRFLVYSNIYVALPVTALAGSSLLLLERTSQWRYLIWIYAITLFTYNFHRLAGIKLKPEQDFSGRMGWAKRNQNLVTGLALVGLILGLVFTQYLGIWKQWYLTIPVVLITAAYSLPILPSKDGPRRRLREIPIVKFLWIGLVVSYLTTLLIGYLINRGSDGYLGFMFLHQALFIGGLTIPFDIRDLEVDHREKLRTLPIVVGVKSAKMIASLLLTMAMIMAIQMNGEFTPGLVASSVLGIVAISRSGRNRSELWYAFGVEGVLVIQPVLIYTMTWLLKGL